MKTYTLVKQNAATGTWAAAGLFEATDKAAARAAVARNARMARLLTGRDQVMSCCLPESTWLYGIKAA